MQIESEAMLLLRAVLTIFKFFVSNVAKGKPEILCVSRKIGCGF